MSAGRADDAPSTPGPEPPPFGETPVFVAGATGYIGAQAGATPAPGGLLGAVPRRPRRSSRPLLVNHPNVSIVHGDLSTTADLASLMRGCGAAFFLVHSLLSVRRRRQRSRRRVGDAVRPRRIRGRPGAHHLPRRAAETGAGVAARLAAGARWRKVLASGDVPATVFRAAMILGFGSVSFGDPPLPGSSGSRSCFPRDG